ncbi:MFS transporter, partial [Amaricoccus sp.]|uniref:MFS transporter n=1 Tax=Amaricoccus sp. TaxID=1872485 RepID=UPI002BD8CCF3
MFLVLLSYLAFFSIALPDSMLGVAWPSMRLSFGQSLGAAGLIPPFGVAATIVSTLLTRHVVAPLGIGRLLAVSTVLSAVGLVISAASPTMAVFLVSVVMLGFSGGAIDVTLNAYAARSFGPRRINLHASYVIGAAASPALVTLFLQVGVSWRVPYLVIAGLQLLLAGVFAVGARRWQEAEGRRRVHPWTENVDQRPEWHR